ncbi:MAG: aldo/keto reductase [Actinomycetota bacterium]|nr:aldo/keto reductase [Actinomycetota bacterium]
MSASPTTRDISSLEPSRPHGSRGWRRSSRCKPSTALLERAIELELVPACLDEGLGVLPWSPLGGGWLTGKYSRDQQPTWTSRLGEDPTRGVEACDLRNTDRTWSVIEACTEVAAAHGVPISAVALAWLRDRPAVSSVILGTRTVEQLDQNLLASELTLTADERTSLDRTSAPGIPLYPHGFIERYGGESVWERLATRNEPPPLGA